MAIKEWYKSPVLHLTLLMRLVFLDFLPMTEFLKFRNVKVRFCYKVKRVLRKKECHVSCSIMQNNFIILKIPCAAPKEHFPFPNPPTAIDLFPISYSSVSFKLSGEWNYTGYSTLCLDSILRSMLLRCVHITVWNNSLFLLIVE